MCRCAPRRQLRTKGAAPANVDRSIETRRGLRAVRDQGRLRVAKTTVDRAAAAHHQVRRSSPRHRFRQSTTRWARGASDTGCRSREFRPSTVWAPTLGSNSCNFLGEKRDRELCEQRLYFDLPGLNDAICKWIAPTTLGNFDNSPVPRV